MDKKEYSELIEKIKKDLESYFDLREKILLKKLEEQAKKYIKRNIRNLK